MQYVNDINLVPKMGQIIKVQILEAAFTIALLGVLLYKYE
jgi:predicted RNA-binding protein with RPS1 domain